MWKRTFLHAAPILLVVLALFYYWFGVANRHVVFLYEHLSAGPFDSRTISRYWMAGLVAAGIVMMMYTVANWYGGHIAGIFRRTYAPPAWWRVWLVCAPFIAVGVLAITMNLNQPVLPASIGAVCSVTTVAALVLALVPGRMAAEQPVELVWLALGGLGLMPALLLLRAVELVSNTQIPRAALYLVTIGGTLAGGFWTCFITWLHSVRCRCRWKTYYLLLSALCLSYLVMPVVHYLLLTPPGYHYISVSDNFFARRLLVQGICFFVAILEARFSICLQR